MVLAQQMLTWVLLSLCVYVFMCVYLCVCTCHDAGHLTAIYPCLIFLRQSLTGSGDHQFG